MVNLKFRLSSEYLKPSLCNYKMLSAVQYFQCYYKKIVSGRYFGKITLNTSTSIERQNRRLHGRFSYFQGMGVAAEGCMALLPGVIDPEHRNWGCRAADSY